MRLDKPEQVYAHTNKLEDDVKINSPLGLIKAN